MKREFKYTVTLNPLTKLLKFMDNKLLATLIKELKRSNSLRLPVYLKKIIKKSQDGVLPSLLELEYFDVFVSE